MPKISRSTLVMVAIEAFVFGTTSTGCSFLFVTEAPPNHQRLPYFDCTSSRTSPVIDTVLAGVYGAAAVGGLIASTQAGSQTGAGDSSSSGLAVTLLPLAFAGGLAASAISGYSQTAKCREAKTELMERLMLRSPALPAGEPLDPWLNPGPAVGGPAGIAPPNYPSAVPAPPTLPAPSTSPLVPTNPTSPPPPGLHPSPPGSSDAWSTPPAKQSVTR